MDNKTTAKNQFDRQAENFSNWSVTGNVEYMQRYFEFCQMTPQDTLLDVACGTGDFSIFCAGKVRQVCGIDISEGMLEIARNRAADGNLKNVRFAYHAVEDLPFEDGAFSFVVCKSAFHHFTDCGCIFGEMVRCCAKDGRVSTQDIVAYGDEAVNDYFEGIEREIDASHNRALSKSDFIKLFQGNGMERTKSLEVEVELNFNEYVNHAVQSTDNLKKIDVMLESGLNDERISKYFTRNNGNLYFKRNVLLVLGKK